MLTFLKNNNLRFKKIAGSDVQLILNDAADLKQIINIDPSLWAVTSLPIENVVFNYQFLKYIDTDNNKKIHPIEFIQALKWLFDILSNYDAITVESDILNLTTLNKENVQAKAINYAVKYINKKIKNKPKNIITLQTVLNFNINEISDELFLHGYNLVKKLLLFQRYMIQFANNYITFDSLYNPNTLSIMQPGYLIMNGNYYTLGCKVDNIEQHKSIVKKSNICTIYIQTISKEEKNVLAFAITQNIKQNLYIGKTGIFIDRRDNSEWDAKIIDIIDQPVTLYNAITYPFNKVHDFIIQNVQRKNISEQYNKLVKTCKSQIIKSQKNNISNSLLKNTALNSIGIAALGSAGAFMISALHSISILSIILFILIAIFLIYIPAVCFSLYKIYNRSITEFYTAGGWSINPKIKLSRKIGIIFTYSPKNTISMKIIKDDLIKKFINQFSPAINFKKIIFILLILICIILIIGIIFLKYFF